MKINTLISKTILLIIFINFWSCTSTVEYTSAKMAIQDENWEEAEQYLLEAVISNDKRYEIPAGLKFLVINFLNTLLKNK